MNRNYLVLLIAILFTVSTTVYAQSEENGEENAGTNPRATHLALGFEMTDIQNDYGLGLNITTPYFAKEKIVIRLHGGISWKEGAAADDLDPNYTWKRYFPLRLGLVISVGMGYGLSRLYSEAGVIICVGATTIAKDMIVGGYGALGFELYPTVASPVAYFIQAGRMGSSGTASELM